jgi:hypothetical protein
VRSGRWPLDGRGAGGTFAAAGGSRLSAPARGFSFRRWQFSARLQRQLFGGGFQRQLFGGGLQRQLFGGGFQRQLFDVGFQRRSR